MPRCREQNSFFSLPRLRVMCPLRLPVDGWGMHYLIQPPSHQIKSHKRPRSPRIPNSFWPAVWVGLAFRLISCGIFQLGGCQMSCCMFQPSHHAPPRIKSTRRSSLLLLTVFTNRVSFWFQSKNSSCSACLRSHLYLETSLHNNLSSPYQEAILQDLIEAGPTFLPLDCIFSKNSQQRSARKSSPKFHWDLRRQTMANDEQVDLVVGVDFGSQSPSFIDFFAFSLTLHHTSQELRFAV